MDIIKAAKEIELLVQPNTFVTLTLRDGVWNKSGCYIRGNFEVYNRVCKGLFKQINKRLSGGRVRRRRGNRLPNWTVFETSKGGLRHIHSCIRRPSHVSIERFDEIVRSCIASSIWILPRCEIKEYLDNGVRYILKDGQDGVLDGSIYF